MEYNISRSISDQTNSSQFGWSFPGLRTRKSHPVGDRLSDENGQMEILMLQQRSVLQARQGCVLF